MFPRPFISLLLLLTAVACESGQNEPNDSGPGADTAIREFDQNKLGDSEDATDTDAGESGDNESSDSEPGADVRSNPDADANISIACGEIPNPNAEWIQSFQKSIIEVLAGEKEISAGQILSDRATAENRKLSRYYLQLLWVELGFKAQFQEYDYQHVISLEIDNGYNIYSKLDATEPSANTYVIGAHYDSVPGGPGANDNATGVAVVYSVARYLATLPCRKASVVFVLFDQEELGLVGSRHFAQWLSDEQNAIIAVHTVDQMGWDKDGDRAIELERPDQGLYEFYRAAVEAGGFSISLIRTETGSTDHVPFREHGFKSIGLTEEFISGDTTPYIHESRDTFETVDFEYTRSTTALINYAFARALTH